MKRLFAPLLYLAPLLFLFHGTIAWAQPFPIATGGEASTGLVIDPQIDVAVRDDFLRILRSATGADFQVVAGGSAKASLIVGTKN
ncbi:MAG: hypothetical protein L3K26_13125, partial [Candidatus Hydrogenedentes bacterium]|nr:hypothetical protein [Candidatus Hydrogenedentota bacterium]